MWKRIKLWWLRGDLKWINRDIRGCEWYLENARGVVEEEVIEHTEWELSGLRRERGIVLEKIERLEKC